MIPESTPTGELPPGIHGATLAEIERRHATNPTRRQQYVGLVDACQGLANAGCATLWLDGSFITTKPEPGDYDATFDVAGIDWIALGLNHPELMDFDNPRTTQKRRYHGELIPNHPAGPDMVAFFQTNRDDHPKGIIEIDLRPLKETP